MTSSTFLTVDQQHGRRERDEVAEVQRFEGEDRWDAILKMNEQWLMRDWGDSFVLHPPTAEAVDELIAGSNLDADELICDMPPGFGLATVEKIAINAAMAGAKPEHMPVIIASVKALSQMGSHGGTSLLMSTSPQAPLLVVNGPIAKELGINARSALGPGRDNQVNITIGRAFSLCLRNIGYWYPGSDGHGHHRHHAQVRALHRRERRHEPVGALPCEPRLPREREHCQRLHHQWRVGRPRPREYQRRRPCSRRSRTAQSSGRAALECTAADNG